MEQLYSAPAHAPSPPPSMIPILKAAPSLKLEKGERTSCPTEESGGEGGGVTWFFDALPPSSRRGLVIAMVASFIFIVLLRFLAGIMVWVMIVMVILVLGYGERVVGSFSLLSPVFLSLSQVGFARRESIHSILPGVFYLNIGIGGVEQRLLASRSPLFSANMTIFCFSPQESSTVTWNMQN